jgi:GNAT superfamily N-acetyltransferase
MSLWRLRATIDDRPGFLAVLAASLALRGVNILSVQVHATPGAAVDEFVVDTPDGMTADELLAAVYRGRGRDAWVGPADAYGLVDPPTQMLALAHRLVGSPDAVGDVLREMLGDCEVSWRARGAGPREGFTPTRLCLPDPDGGVLVVKRTEPVFTPAEYARAYSMASLAAGLLRVSAPRLLVALADGAEVVVRPGGLADLPEIVAMHGRCSPESLRQRYGSAEPVTARRLAAMLGAPGQTLVAAAGSPLVAVAQVAGDGPDAELSLLVEDAWQRRGLGRVLQRRAVEAAERAGYQLLRIRGTARVRILR